MTPAQANAINLSEENDPEVLKQLVKYWQNRAIKLRNALLGTSEVITQNQLEDRFDLEKINSIIKES